MMAKNPTIKHNVTNKTDGGIHHPLMMRRVAMMDVVSMAMGILGTTS